MFPPQDIIISDPMILSEFLREIPPYPPYRVGWTVIGVLIMTILTTTLSGYGYLRCMRRWGRNS